MNYKMSYASDVGIKKQVNQDSICIKKALTNKGEILLAVLCDGMGGLSDGEIASATVVRSFADWFMQKLPLHLSNQTIDSVSEDIRKHIVQWNRNIWEYGLEHHVQLGTTLTAMLILEDGSFFVVHVGDTRIYRVTQGEIFQITEDHSFVAREVKRGNMTKEEATMDPRRNVLLQCIGAQQQVEPDIFTGRIQLKDTFLLCSDGLRHKMTDLEILDYISGIKQEDERAYLQVLQNMIAVNKERGETDNISAILIKAC